MHSFQVTSPDLSPMSNTMYIQVPLLIYLHLFSNLDYFIADRNNLTLNSMKKRQRTKKFPMTAGSWTGPEGPTGILSNYTYICTMP